MKIGYVVKRYPRYSETFIVNEILAHEAAGIKLEIFSLPPEGGHFQDAICRERAPVSYLPPIGLTFSEFWSVLEEIGKISPEEWNVVEAEFDIYRDAAHVRETLYAADETRAEGIRKAG